jgi:hypothetical protein
MRRARPINQINGVYAGARKPAAERDHDELGSVIKGIQLEK